MAASLNRIVDVDVYVTSPTSISSDFSLGCLLYTQPNTDTTRTLKEYFYNSYKAELVSDGFAANSAVYKNIDTYFSQNPHPNSVLLAGKLNSEASYAVAFQAIRSLNEKFYTIFIEGATDVASTATTMAAAVESSSIPTMFIMNTSLAAAIGSSDDTILSALKAANYTRTLAFYSSSTSEYVSAAAAGLICGMNSLKANSAYTAAYKVLAGITAQDLNDSAMNNLIAKNGNAYAKFGEAYSFTYPMVTSGGYHVDEIFLIDAAKYLIQQYAVAGLTSVRRVPQTEDGVNTLISFVNDACNVLATAGFISSGIWRGQQVLNLEPGDAVDGGFLIQADSIYDQSAADRQARKSPTIYVALLASGAIESVVIQVYINR